MSPMNPGCECVSVDVDGLVQVNVVNQFQPTDKLVGARLGVACAGAVIGFTFFWLYISFIVDLTRHVRSS